MQNLINIIIVIFTVSNIFDSNSSKIWIGFNVVFLLLTLLTWVYSNKIKNKLKNEKKEE